MITFTLFTRNSIKKPLLALKLFVLLLILAPIAHAQTISIQKTPLPREPQQQIEKQPDRNLVIGITQYPGTLNPLLDSSVVQSYVLGLVQRPFTTFDVNWQLICMLCTEIPTLENGLAKKHTFEDGTEGIAVTFSIDPKAVWGDGTPISSRDVVFTWQVGRTAAVGAVGMQTFQRIKDITVQSEKTFTLYWDTVRHDYNHIGSFGLLPAHIESAAFASPTDYRTRTRFDTNFIDPGLYFGPYRVQDKKAGSHITFTRNPLWWGKAPAFDTVTVRTVENTASLEANLLSGEITMIAGEAGIDFDQALSFKERHSNNYQIIFKPSLLYEHIDINLNHEILKDVRVRQALLYAINRQALNDFGFASRQIIAHSMVNPLDRMHYEQVRQYEYDPGRATELLEAAGWILARDGFRYNQQGQRLRFEYITTAGNRSRELIQQVLQNYWRQIGIDVSINNQPSRVLFGETLPQQKFRGVAMYAWSSSPGGMPRTTLHSEYIPSVENAFAGQNYTGYNNPDIDALLDTLETELDDTNRRKLWAKLQSTYAEDLPSLPLFFRSNAFIIPKNFTGLEPTGHQAPTTYWIEYWELR